MTPPKDILSECNHKNPYGPYTCIKLKDGDCILTQRPESGFNCTDCGFPLYTGERMSDRDRLICRNCFVYEQYKLGVRE